MFKVKHETFSNLCLMPWEILDSFSATPYAPTNIKCDLSIFLKCKHD